jgi:hypothetical protein
MMMDLSKRILTYVLFLQSAKWLAFLRRSSYLVRSRVLKRHTGGTLAMIERWTGAVIGSLLMLAFGLASLATYGLTSKGYLENFIVFQAFSGQALPRNNLNATSVEVYPGGQSEQRIRSQARSTPHMTSDLLDFRV